MLFVTCFLPYYPPYVECKPQKDRTLGLFSYTLGIVLRKKYKLSEGVNKRMGELVVSVEQLL